MTDREVEVMREVEMLKSAGAIADRDMHAWWAEYDGMMADYQSKRDGMICTQEDLLADLLGAIKVKVERVNLSFSTYHNCGELILSWQILHGKVLCSEKSRFLVFKTTIWQ